MNRGNTTTAVSITLRVTPEITDDFTEIKIWQDRKSDMMHHQTLGPISARMECCSTVPVSSIVERINSFISEEVATVKSKHTKCSVWCTLWAASEYTTAAYHINNISFEGTDFLSSRDSSAESVGLKSGCAFQVEYTIYTITHSQVTTCCAVS